MHSDAELAGWIKGGKPGTPMPAFGEQLSDAQVWQVITYIRQFNPHAGHTQDGHSHGGDSHEGH